MNELNEFIPEDLLKAWADEIQRELENVLRVLTTMNYCVEKLYDILPLTREFNFGKPIEKGLFRFK